MGRNANDTPTLANGVVAPSDKSRRNGRGTKRARGDDEEDGDSNDGDEDGRPSAKRSGTGNGKKTVPIERGFDITFPESSDPVMGAGGDVDETVYCYCQSTSYGEMIGCDDEECELEWVSAKSNWRSCLC